MPKVCLHINILHKEVLFDYELFYTTVLWVRSVKNLEIPFWVSSVKSIDLHRFSTRFTWAKAKRKKKSMSQNLWQIGRPDLNVCLFVCLFSEQQTCQIWLGHNFVQYEIWNLIYRWTRHKTEHMQSRRSLVYEVSYCVCCVFSCIFWQASS